MIYRGAYYPPPFPPLLAASCLSFSVFLCVAGRAYWRERGLRVWTRNQIIRQRENLALYKAFNTLWLYLFVCEINEFVLDVPGQVAEPVWPVWPRGIWRDSLDWFLLRARQARVQSTRQERGRHLDTAFLLAAIAKSACLLCGQGLAKLVVLGLQNWNPEVLSKGLLM